MIDNTATTTNTQRGQWIDRWARTLVHGMLSRITEGRLTVRDEFGVAVFGEEDAPRELSASLHIHSPRLYRTLLTGGTLAGAATFIDQMWTTDNLTAVIRVFARNRAVNEGFDTGWAWLARRAAAVGHALNRNTRQGSARNIQAHYDLGNDFFRLFLDESLTYSAGIFETPTSTLADASRAKYERICRKLDLGPDDHVLEIGTGWGGFTLHAVQHYGCRVTTTTISAEQAKLARQRFVEAGIDSRVTLLQSDYRDLSGAYDKIVSIEMIEAVGHEFLGRFFQACSDLLAPGGEMLIQVITMADQRYDAYRVEADFIQKYIFPGSCLPSVTALCNAATRSSDLRLVSAEDITPHYAETLRRWRAAFTAKLDQVRQQGFDESFIRTWLYYFGYCEAGFEERNIGDLQLLFQRLDCRRELPLPALSRRRAAAPSASFDDGRGESSCPPNQPALEAQRTP